MSTQVMSSSPAPSSLPSSAMKAVRSCGEDYKGHPIVVISAANFPNPNEISYDQILASIQPQLERMTQREYVVVLFNHGMVYHPSWDWLKGAFTSLDEKYKKNLASLYLVHPALWQIVGLQMAGLLLGRGNPFYSKVNFIFRLSELEEHLPLPQLYVPPVVREYDLKYYGPRKPLLGALLAPPSTAQFGVPLSQLMGQGKGEGEGEGMPRVFSETTRYLREKGEGVDDLFTKSPLHHAVQECVDIYNRGRSPNLNNYDVYIASALLKRFLRDLPDSTVPQEFNYLVASLGRAEESKEKLSIVEEVFKALPDENRRLLTSLIVFLKEICEASQDPRAQLLNVAFAFGPNLVSPDLLLTNVGESHSLVRLMIENDSLFAPREAPSAKRAVAATTTFTQAKRRYEEMEKKSAKKASPSSSSTSTSTASSSSSSSSSSSASSASSPAKKERGFHDVLVWQHGPSYARVAHLALDVPPSPEVTSAMSKGPQAGEEQQEKEKKEEKEEKEKAKPKAKEQKRKEERKEERRETKERKEEKKPALEDVFSSSTSPASEVVPVSYADAAAQGAKLALKEKEEQFRRQREAMFEELKVKAGEISRQRKARGLDQPSPAPRPSGKRTAIPPAWLLQDMREHAEEERRRKEEEEREREREERRRKGEEKRARREAAKQARAEKQAREAREFNETYAPLKPEPKNVFGEASRPAWLELELEEEAAKRQTAAKMQLVLRYLLVRTSFRRAELDLAQEKQAARLSARLRDMENHQRNVERKRLAHERQEREREARRQKELETRARVREEQRRAEEAARERKKRRALEAEEAKKQREEAAKVREEELKQRRLQAAEREREERERVEEERREKARVRQEQVRVQHHREAKKDKFATYKASFCPAPSDLASQASHLRHVQVSAAASSSSSSASASASSPSRSSSTLSLGQVEEMMAALTLDLEPQDPAALNWTPGLDGRVAQEGKEILAVLGELSSNLEQGYRLQDRENSPAVSQPKNNQGKGGKGKNKGKGGSQLKQRLAGDDDLHTESSELRYVGAVDNMDSEGPIPAMPGKGVTKPSAPLRKLASSPSPSPSPSREQSELHTESSELRYVGAVDNMDSEGPIPAMPGKGVTKPTAPLRRLSVPSPAPSPSPSREQSELHTESSELRYVGAVDNMDSEGPIPAMPGKGVTKPTAPLRRLSVPSPSPSREQSELHTESSELRYVGAILDMETEGPTHHQLGAAKRSELSTKAEIDVKASRPAKPGRNQSPPQSQEKKQQQQGTAQPKSSAGLFTSADLTKKASELHPPRSSAGSMTSSGPGAPTAEAKTATVAAPKPRRAPISYADIAKRSIAVGDQ